MIDHAATSVPAPLLDSFGRRHSDLRISVTDRCNIRCFYCMPAEVVRFKPRDELLTFEEIERFVRILAPLGIDKLRITGGEPLVRSALSTLIAKLAVIPGIEDIALTTNGILLADQAQGLKQAGLKRLNVSLDTLREEKFREITRREGFQRVLEGIFAARAVGFDKIKINAVAIAGLTEEDVLPFGEFSRKHDLEVRFIEYMPLDADGGWRRDQVLSGEKIRAILEQGVGPLDPVPSDNPGQPSTDFRFRDGMGRIGFINPVSQPFCDRCNRLRVTAEGKVRNCLFASDEWDAKALLRGGADDETIAELVRDCVMQKRAAHGIDTQAFVRPERAMYQIGG